MVSWVYKFVDISASGILIDQAAGHQDLELNAEEGTILGDMRCIGTLVKPDDATIHFDGSIVGHIARKCVRCLSEFEESLNSPCSAVFRKVSAGPSGYGTVRSRSLVDDYDSYYGNEEPYPITGNQIDLLPVIREHIILSAPFQALCSEACEGLCQGCGVNLNNDRCLCAVPNPVQASEGVFHPDLSKAHGQEPRRKPGSRRKGPLRKL